MGKYFGTDGFRGEAGITLTADHAYKVGRFLGWYYNALRERNGDTDPARIVIGKDTRRSSYMFEYSLVAGLTASGADAYLLHVTTTPSVAYIARVDDFDCGIMISASHNPYYDNGIKLIDCYGEKMPEETLLLVEDYIDGKLHVFDKDWPELPFAHREHIGCTVDYVAGRNRYMGYLISLGIYSFKGVKVGLDCANPFFGFGKDGSFVAPSEYTKDMRANYRYIPYLYCATRPYLSVVEVRPRLGARVSVARIRVNERLRLLDFSLQNYPKGMKPVKINLFHALSQLYSKPVTEDDDTLDYIPTQYIAEFVKRIGYDGIVFKSSLYNDENIINVVIFNFDKCEAVGSVVYDVTRNDYTCEMEDPVSELRLNFQLQLTPDNN